MSDESVVTQLVEPPSVLIRRGIPMIEERRDEYYGCALGTAYFVKTGHRVPIYFLGMPGHQFIADHIGLPHRLAHQVSNMHSRGATREQCADFFESQGY